MNALSIYRLVVTSVGLATCLAFSQASPAHEPSFSVLHSFDVPNADSGVSPTGSSPDTRPVLGLRGDIYGMSYWGGVNGTGVVYRYDPYSGEYSVLHAFGAQDANGLNVDGANPGVGLTRGSDDVFYGMASNGGKYGSGTIFSLTAAGKFKVLYAFSATDANGYNRDGANPLRTLVVGQDGRVYGTTRLGGTAGLGVAFVIDQQGRFSVIHEYTATEGHAASLTQGYDGYLYGCAVYPIAKLGAGMLYRMQTSGHAFEVLHTFQAVDANLANADGADCYEPLTEGRPGEFFGATRNGGRGATGVVFRYTDRGGLQVIHQFSALNADGSTNADGANPYARMTLGRDGSLYSTTSYGGPNGSGVVYRISSDGGYGILYAFSATNSADGSNKDGATPDFGVILDGCDELVGMADEGGLGSTALDDGSGTLYRLSLH